MSKKTQKKQDENEQKKKKKKKSGTLLNVVLILVLLAGASVMAYPTVSDWWNSMHASRAIADYKESVDKMDQQVIEDMLREAHEYNDALPLGTHFNLTDEEYAYYENLLDITGTGIMGYIQIPSINVNLPIYHGTEESVLQVAVGHISGTSLPVGGQSSHSVLSGHRGLPSARLFTDLDQLKEGDVFTITVLTETFTYLIDQIRIVLPEEVGNLAIEEDHDYCTLVTCTPYGINTHRMLVRGHRIENAEGAIYVPVDASRVPSYLVIPAVGIPLLFILLVVMLIYYARKKPRKSYEEILEEIKDPGKH